jgi:crotonobetainyl-CoA:carnitine CoA-transferase CaiB-like acyl-CoA transferase
MCSVTAFGPDGPYAQRPAYDPIVQAVAGYADVQADADGTPQLVRTIVCDKVTALNVAQSICAALVARGNGAGGQHIEVAMLDASVHFLWPDAMWNATYLDHDIEMPELSSIYRLQQSSDGWVIVYAISTDPQWQAMCVAFGRPDLAQDPRFADLQARLRNGDAANEAMQAETGKYTTHEVVEMMDRAGVPAAPVNTRARMPTDPQVLHRGLVVETDHPSAGRIRSIRPTTSFSKTPSSLRSPAPRFGEHTDQILTELLELTAEELAGLRARGAIR